MRGIGIGVLALIVLGIVTIAVIAATGNRSSGAATVDPPHMVSMEQSAQVMQQAGGVLGNHGQAMLDEGRQRADQNLTAHGEHWLRDGQALVQGGQWMAMNPLAPGSAAPDAAIDAGNRGELNRSVQVLLHDPRKARAVDIEALRWNGMAMRGEGRNMVDHGQVMTEEVEVMVVRHGLDAQTADALRQAAAAMQQVGEQLMRNGQGMTQYADQLRRSMGSR